MKKFLGLIIIALGLLLPPLPALAAGASVSGGGTKTVGSNFTVTVTASGAEFDSLQGVISISGPVSIVSFAGGGATWLPGKSPSNGGQFVGITNPTTKLTVASITLKGTKEGKGSVSVSSVRLARNGAYVGTDGGSTSFTITRAPTPPGGVEVSSTTHPDQAASYEATTVELSWKAPANGANGYSVVFDQVATTVPGTQITTTDTVVKYENLPVASHYFHIRANNGDGWGATTHFQINIKEPDPKVNDTLAQPTIIGVEKTDTFRTDIETGTVSGFKLKGTIPVGYIAILSLDPKDRLLKALYEPLIAAPKTTTEGEATTTPPAPEVAPEPKIVTGVKMTPLTAEPNAEGNWEVLFEAAIPSGFYKVTVQGQQEKVLTPISAPSYLEVSVADGGKVKFITADDLPKGPALGTKLFGVQFRQASHAWLTLAGGIILLGLIGGLIYYLRRRKPLRSPLD